MKKQTLLLSALALSIGLSLSVLPPAAASLPTQVPGQGALPSLAPMLEKVLPAVVSVQVEGTASPTLNMPEYREELVSHFARSAELLDTMAHDYRQLYQHMAKSSSSLLPELSAEATPVRNRLAESEASNDQAPVQMPRDYSEGASGLLRTGAKRD